MCAILAGPSWLQGRGSIRGDQWVRKGSCWLQSPSFGDHVCAKRNLRTPHCHHSSLCMRYADIKLRPVLFIFVFTYIFSLLQPKHCRTIWHYQYMSWPDHGVPQEPGGVLSFLTQVNTKQAEHPDAGPMIIHCRYESTAAQMPQWTCQGL